MNEEMAKKVVNMVLTALELGGVLGLTGIALKRNSDCYKAQCDLAETEIKLAAKEAMNEIQAKYIDSLKEENQKLKSKKKFTFKKES